MTNITFSYIFDEELNRIYECFVNPQLNSGVVYNNLVTQLKFIKGDRFDELNSEFSFIWKNYYEIKMIVDEVKNNENFRTYTNRSLYIDKISLQIYIKYNFIWETIQQKTILIVEIGFTDEFFKDLIKNDFNQSDVLNMCKNVENYLINITRGLEIRNSFLLNTSIEEIWKTISDPTIFFTVSGKKLIPIFKDKEISLNSVLEFYDANDKQETPTVLTQMNVDTLFVTSNYIKLSFITSKKLYMLSHKITFIVKKLDIQKSMFITSIRILEPCEHKRYLSVVRFWKNIMNNYYNYCESKSKNKKSI